MQKILDQFLNIIDFVNEWSGRVVALLIPVVTLIVSYEVIMRYFFRAPTTWAWDINVQLLAIIVFFGGGYLLLHDGHVRVDVLYGRLPAKWKTILDLITSPIFFLYLGAVLWKFIVLTLDSIEEREVTNTLFAPPVYPLKIVCSFGFFLFLMQGVARFIRNLRLVVSGRWN
jgi:TRAP-type mannitol/chloroaromatic compound transport system permease small subunit